MPRWSFSKPKPPPEEPPQKPAKDSAPALPERRARDVSASDSAAPAGRVDDANPVQARLKEDLAELLTAHRHQGRVLERSQKQLDQTEQELAQVRTRAGALEREIAEQRSLAGQRDTKIRELELMVDKHATLEASYEAIDRERKDLDGRLTELTRSRANADAERDRLAGELAGAHATIAARDAAVAALNVQRETVEAHVRQLQA